MIEADAGATSAVVEQSMPLLATPPPMTNDLIKTINAVSAALEPHPDQVSRSTPAVKEIR